MNNFAKMVKNKNNLSTKVLNKGSKNVTDSPKTGGNKFGSENTPTKSKGKRQAKTGIKQQPLPKQRKLDKGKIAEENVNISKKASQIDEPIVGSSKSLIRIAESELNEDDVNNIENDGVDLSVDPVEESELDRDKESQSQIGSDSGGDSDVSLP